MIKTGLSYLKWAPIAIVLVIGITLSIRPSAATNPPLASDSEAPGADTSNEERIIGKYMDDLFSYQNEINQAKKRQVLQSAEIDPWVRRSEGLQSRLSEVQNAVREIIRKFKAANEFDGLDSALLARASDPRRRAFYQANSFKEDLEYAASNLTNHRDEISQPLEVLRRKVASNADWNSAGRAPLVMATYHRPAAMFGRGLGCRIATIRWNLIDKNGGSVSGNAATCTAIACACQSGSPCPPYDCPGSATQ